MAIATPKRVAICQGPWFSPRLMGVAIAIDPFQGGHQLESPFPEDFGSHTNLRHTLKDTE